jgi:hypothetical protein
MAATSFPEVEGQPVLPLDRKRFNPITQEVAQTFYHADYPGRQGAPA